MSESGDGSRETEGDELKDKFKTLLEKVSKVPNHAGPIHDEKSKLILLGCIYLTSIVCYFLPWERSPS